MRTGDFTFKYRYVPTGTRFTSARGRREAADQDERTTLFDNEVAVGVGREHWAGQPGVVDHRAREGGLPSSAVAVIHHAEPLWKRAHDLDSGLVWLVTHKFPNFDCHAGMYLARWIMSDPAAVRHFRAARLTTDGFDDDVEAPEQFVRRFDWFKPDLTRFAPEVGWAVLLASYAAHTARAGRIPCPRNRTLLSILYAAVRRGRPYLAEDTGAQEFFETVRRAMNVGAPPSRTPLNPFYDSVLEKEALFAPERELLDVAVQAYERDIARARKAVVFLPMRDGAFSALYDKVNDIPLLDADGKIDEAHLKFGGESRKQVDALYLRDPECILLREWAQLDIDNSSLREGFTFTMVANSGARPGPNDIDYFMAIDPKVARHGHLYPVWARLQAAEIRAFSKAGNDGDRAALRSRPRDGYAGRAGPFASLFGDPWYDGFNYSCRVVGAPERGTLLPPTGVKRGLEDDEVAKIVQDELEFGVFDSPFTFRDVAAQSNLGEVKKTPSVDSARDVPLPVPEGCYRFGKVKLSKYVRLDSDVFAEQTARVLWQMLHPQQMEGPPRDLAEECCVREAEMIGVWSTTGVMIAYQQSATDSVHKLEQLFDKLAELARGVEKLILEYSAGDAASAGETPKKVAARDARLRESLRSSRELTRLMIDIRKAFSLPEGRVIERFARRSPLFDTINMVHDATRNEQTQSNLDLTERLTEASVTVASVQLKVELLELIFVAIYSTELAHIIAPHVVPPAWELAFTLTIAFGLSAIAYWYLNPLKHGNASTGRVLVGGFLAVILGGIGFGAWSGFRSLSESAAAPQTPAARASQPPGRTLHHKQTGAQRTRRLTSQTIPVTSPESATIP